MYDAGACCGWRAAAVLHPWETLHRLAASGIARKRSESSCYESTTSVRLVVGPSSRRSRRAGAMQAVDVRKPGTASAMGRAVPRCADSGMHSTPRDASFNPPPSTVAECRSCVWVAGADFVLPPAVCADGRVSIVAPAGPVNSELLAQGCELIRAWWVSSKDGYLAGTDVERAAALIDAFEDPSTSAVVCAKGG
eukprot:scaffold841_cov397-Prasinococcus_capsulatus_cf.AAC.5